MNAFIAETDRTNSSLLRRIKSLSDAPGWSRFYETYAPLIERLGTRFGLNQHEREDVVQGTMIQVSKTIDNYDRAKGAFKAWLCNCARWKIMDVLRARPKNTVRMGDDSGLSAAVSEDQPDLSVSVFERIWDDEWEEHLKRNALEQIKRKISGSHYQIFHLYVVEGMAVKKVAALVGVTVAQVYLVKCRVARMLKKELAAQN